MKYTLILLVALCVAGFLIYNHFKTPKYPNETVAYVDYLNELATEVNSSNSGTWQAGHNANWDFMGKDAIKGLMGVRKEPSPIKLRVVDTVVDDIPDEFDPRKQWPDCKSIQEVRDQANCGSCWAFGMVEAGSDRICINTQGKNQTRLSSQNLVTCCDECGMGCNGGWPEMAWQYYVDTGIVTGDLYGDDSYCQPYFLKPCDHHIKGKYGPCPDVVPTPDCENQCNSKYKTPYDKDLQFASDSYSVSADEKAIQTELMTKGPAEAAFTVYEDFLTYKSGVYKHVKGEELGGHAIKIMGWGVDNGTKYWLCANSWNEGWGDKGYFKILRGSDECGIESDICAGTPKV